MNVTKNFDTVRQNIIDQCENSILGLACGHIPNLLWNFFKGKGKQYTIINNLKCFYKVAASSVIFGRLMSKWALLLKKKIINNNSNLIIKM